jgi:hypothetical protein
MNPKHFGSYARTVAIVGLTAAGCGTSSTVEPPKDEVTVAFDALSSAIAACGGDLAMCSQAADGDVTALETCRETFAGCQQTAGGPAAGALANAVVACTENTGTCASDAGGQAAAACHEELQTCLGANRPAPPEHDAGSAGGGHAAPVAPCIDDLLACITGDGDVKTCALAVRTCIIANVPAPPGVIPEDPGSAAGDAGMQDDHPEPPADAGMPDDLPEPPTPDAGMAGEPPAATCMEAFDACIEAGGTPKTCGMALRECER